MGYWHQYKAYKVNLGQENTEKVSVQECFFYLGESFLERLRPIQFGIFFVRVIIGSAISENLEINRR